MAAAKEIKSLLREAQLYQSQGLLKEARSRYENAITLVEKDDTIPIKSQLLEGIQKKLQSLDEDTYRVEKKTPLTEISPREKDLIKRLFSTEKADDKDASILDGAVALAKFGQFDRAISEFEDLLENSPLRIVAAKHILRCHMALRALHDPVVQFQKWVTTGYFKNEELSALSTFLERTYELSVAEPDPAFQTTVSGATLSEAVEAPADGSQPPHESPEESDYDPYEDEYVDVLDVLNAESGGNNKAEQASSTDDFVDMIPEPEKKKTLRYEDIAGDDTDDYVDYISSIGIPIQAGKNADLPVNLQTGSVINLIVSANMKAVMERLKKGVQVDDVKLNSPISVTTGKCTIVNVARIGMGPKKGDYSVDLKIET